MGLALGVRRWNESFKNLDVWEVAMGMVESIYRITSVGQLARDFGLKDQMRRSAVSVPSNIAEGCDRRTDKEFLYFLNIARGSLAELRTQLEIARRVEFLEVEAYDAMDDLCCKIGAMLIKLIRARTYAQ